MASAAERAGRSWNGRDSSRSTAPSALTGYIVGFHIEFEGRADEGGAYRHLGKRLPRRVSPIRRCGQSPDGDYSELSRDWMFGVLV